MCRCVFRASTIAFAAVLIGQTMAWPQREQDEQQSSMPTIELSLEPPASILKYVSSEIGDVEKSREMSEKAAMNELSAHRHQSLQDAAHEVHAIVARNMRAFDDTVLKHKWQKVVRGDRVSAPPAFLERAIGKGTADFKVNVKTPATTFMTPAIRDKLRGMEEARSDREVQLLRESVNEFEALAAIALNEFESQLQANINGLLGGTVDFVEATFSRADGATRLPQANVNVVPADVLYPTASSLMADMARRGDVAGSLLRATILDLDLSFLEDFNRVCETVLHDALSRVMEP